MAVFYEASAGEHESWPVIGFPTIDVNFRHPKGTGGRRAVLVAMSFRVYGGSIGGITRGASYDGVPMTSLGVQAFNDEDGGWLEVFGILDAPAGGAVRAVLSDGLFSARWMRAASISYTGVEDFGDVDETYGSGTSLTGAATAPSAGRSVQVFGTKGGLTGYTQTQRYLSSSGIALLAGDVAGDGGEENFAATRASSGSWAGISVVLNPADIVGSAKPLVTEPLLYATGRRLPRPGIPRRVVFDIQPEA